MSQELQSLNYGSVSLKVLHAAADRARNSGNWNEVFAGSVRALGHDFFYLPDRPQGGLDPVFAPKPQGVSNAYPHPSIIAPNTWQETLKC